MNKKRQGKTNLEKSQKIKILSLGSFMAFLIAISPYIFYLYESFPDAKTWNTLLFHFETRHNDSLYVTAWYFMNKFVPLMLMIIWFFTCKHWWYHVILIPISMYVFQLFSLINDDIRYIDEFEIYYIIPIMMIVIPIVYLIRLKLIDKYIYDIDLEKIDKELEAYRQKEKED